MEFSEWLAVYKIDPFGNEREDLRMALLAATIANAHRGKDQEPYEVEFFMPKLGERLFMEDPEEAEAGPEKIGPEHGASLLAMLNTMYGGIDLRE